MTSQSTEDLASSPLSTLPPPSTYTPIPPLSKLAPLCCPVLLSSVFCRTASAEAAAAPGGVGILRILKSSREGDLGQGEGRLDVCGVVQPEKVERGCALTS